MGLCGDGGVVVWLACGPSPRAYPARRARAPSVARKGRWWLFIWFLVVVWSAGPATPGIPRSLRCALRKGRRLDLAVPPNGDRPDNDCHADCPHYGRPSIGDDWTALGQRPTQVDGFRDGVYVGEPLQPTRH